MDAAKGFARAIAALKEEGIWLNIRHLHCQWHIYKAIKQHIAVWFKQIERGRQQCELNRFITAFKNVVCAPTEVQMHALWNSLEQDGHFPALAIT